MDYGSGDEICVSNYLLHHRFQSSMLDRKEWQGSRGLTKVRKPRKRWINVTHADFFPYGSKSRVDRGRHVNRDTIHIADIVRSIHPSKRKRSLPTTGLTFGRGVRPVGHGIYPT